MNHIISECNKVTQKEYKTGHDHMGKGTLWKLYKRLKFDYSNKLYIHKPKSILENENHEILWDFENKQVTKFGPEDQSLCWRTGRKKRVIWWILSFKRFTKSKYPPHHHHHHVVPPAWISLTLSRHSSLSFIASGRYSGLYPVSSQSCCM